MNTPFQPLNLAMRWAIRGLAALVVVAHGALLWDRVRADELRDPAVAGRWLLSLAFVAAAWQLRRMGLLSFRGRRALVFWLAVVMLHAAFLIPAGFEAEPLLLATPGWLAAPVAWFAALGAALLVGARLSSLVASSASWPEPNLVTCLPAPYGGFGSAWNDRGPPARR